MVFICNHTKVPKGEQFDVSKLIEFHDIPYFAHQELEHSRYKTAITEHVKPVGVLPPIISRNLLQSMDEEYEEDAGQDMNPVTPKQGNKRQRATSASGSNSKKRIKGGRAAVAKKITADLDSDDELIVSMKNAKFLEKDIADKLAAEGRIKYNPKTIGTRWARIRKKLQQHQDELLDADLTDWHDGDDLVLYQALQNAEKQVEKWKQEAEDRKWRVVADEMHNIKPVTNFSQNACRKRFDALQNGTAKLTPESILNPDEDILHRIESRKNKEEKVRHDQFLNPNKTNIEGNSWTSRTRKYI